MITFYLPVYIPIPPYQPLLFSSTFLSLYIGPLHLLPFLPFIPTYTYPPPPPRTPATLPPAIILPFYMPHDPIAAFAWRCALQLIVPGIVSSSSSSSSATLFLPRRAGFILRRRRWRGGGAWHARMARWRVPALRWHALLCMRACVATLTLLALAAARRRWRDSHFPLFVETFRRTRLDVAQHFVAGYRAASSSTTPSIICMRPRSPIK